MAWVIGLCRLICGYPTGSGELQRPLVDSLGSDLCPIVMSLKLGSVGMGICLMGEQAADVVGLVEVASGDNVDHGGRLN